MRLDASEISDAPDSCGAPDGSRAPDSSSAPDGSGAPGSTDVPGGSGEASPVPVAGEDGLEELLGRLSLEQKVRLLTGASSWRTHAEPLVGLRALVFSDGPVGVRGEVWEEPRPGEAVTLPSPTAQAASWDEELVRELGALLAAQARRKGVDVLLAPNLNLHRTAWGGRHFECFSEDPLLAGRIGAAYVRGVQGGGVAATAKHFVGNETETDRLTLDSRIGERALHEVYLAPFEAAVAAGVRVVMSAYNRTNGTTMSESPLLADPLKAMWGFDGLVVSDWGAVRSAEASARAAQDLAMPGPDGPWREGLPAAVRAGAVSEAAIDDKVRRLLRLARFVSAVGLPSGTGACPEAGLRPGSWAGHRATGAPEPPYDAACARALMRRAVAAGSVLLRNEGGLLPLDPGRLGTVAVLGPNAASVRAQGGGSGHVRGSGAVSPLDGLARALVGRARVVHAAGVYPPRPPDPLGAPRARDPLTGEPGVRVRFLDAREREVYAVHRSDARVVEPVLPVDFGPVDSVEIHAVLRPEVSGCWRLALGGLGRVRLEADGRTVLDSVTPRTSDDPIAVHIAPPHREVPLELTAGRDVVLRARRWLAPGDGRAVVLAADPPRPGPEEALAEAVALARGAEAAVVVVGTTEEAESEGWDRGTLALPGRQDELVEAVAAANPRTVVVVNSGGPVLMPWRERVPALLLGWFPGQEAGDGLADVLLGAAEPGGRLPTTWPAADADPPVAGPRPGQAHLDYAEGVHVGHRAWLRAAARPAYWFGHGLGYTEWAYEELSVPPEWRPGAPLRVAVRLRNTGPRPGREVVQVYLSRPGGSVERPVRWLAGFAPVTAAPGESVRVEIPLAPRAFAHWSVADGGWRTEPGRFAVLVGRSVADPRLRGSVTVRE